MSTTANGTFEAAKNMMGSAGEGVGRAAGVAGHAIGSAEQGVEHAGASALSAMLKGVGAVTGLMRMMRSLDSGDALGWIGLERRRHPLLSFGIFGAGIALGAGAGMLFAPMSGGDLRRLVMGRLAGLTHEANGAVGEVVSAVKETAKTAPLKPEVHPRGDGHLA